MTKLPLAALAVLLTALPARSALVERWADETADGARVRVFEVFDGAGKAPKPGVLLFHSNADGVNEWIKDLARRLAREGYVVMAPVLVSTADLKGAKEQLELPASGRTELNLLADRRAAAALAVLRRDARVRKDRVGAVGYCHLGGPAAMDLARADAGLSAVATFWGGVSPSDISAAWARRRLGTKILVMLGGRDVETNPYLPSFEEEMRAGRADWRLVLYGRAEHGFSMPGPHPAGRGAYDPDADRRSWKELESFLDETLKPGA